MGKKKSCTPALRELIVGCYQNEKQSMSAIAKRFCCSKKMVFGAIQLFKRTGSFENRKRMPMPRKTSPYDDRIICRTSKANPFLTSTKINELVAPQITQNISARTVRRRLQEAGLHGCIARKKPHVSTKNIKKRLQFAKEHLNKPANFWKKVLWSDESKFNLFGSDGKVYVRRPLNKSLDPRYTIKTIKHGGGNVMVWGAFSWYGVGPIHRIEGRMDQHQYKNILENVMEPFSFENMPITYIFQQDNDPKHTSRVVKQWFTDSKTNILSWPAQSPDLNPIENLWADVERGLKMKNPRNMDEHFQNIKEVWQLIPPSRCRTLVESLPKRLADVIRYKGYPTKY